MRLRDEGASYTVFVSAREVEEFNHHYPCSSLKGRQAFTFASNGDLVDRFGEGGGPEAVALFKDAQEYAVAVAESEMED